MPANAKPAVPWNEIEKLVRDGATSVEAAKAMAEQGVKISRQPMRPGFLMPTRPPVHRPAHVKPRQQRAADYDADRGSAASRGYGHDWRKLRAAKLRADPLCEHCKAEGRITEAIEVDHIVPHRGDDTLRLAWTNLQSLCKPHHSSKTRRESGGRRGGAG